MPVYVLDSNIFIQAHRSSYPLDVVTSFWETIKSLADNSKIISIDKVRDEISKNEDELTIWIDSNLPKDFFKSTDEQSVIDEYAKIVPWAESWSDHYHRGAIDEFLKFSNADTWLIAYCKMSGDRLVTQETSNPDQKRRIPIPEPCNHFDIRYCNMITMFRELGVTF